MADQLSSYNKSLAMWAAIWDMMKTLTGDVNVTEKGTIQYQLDEVIRINSEMRDIIGENEDIASLADGTLSTIISKLASNTLNLTMIEKTLTITEEWQDIGLSGSDLSTGAYNFILNVSGLESGYGSIYSGVMTWTPTSTDYVENCEIPMHRCTISGGANVKLRTVTGSGPIKLQICGDGKNAPTEVTLKINKVVSW